MDYYVLLTDRGEHIPAESGTRDGDVIKWSSLEACQAECDRLNAEADAIAGWWEEGEA